MGIHEETFCYFATLPKLRRQRENSHRHVRQERKEQSTLAKKPRALRKGSLNSKLARVSPKKHIGSKEP
eukprot:1139203-Pelagomonas_calceolata.AAC.4